jgi:protein phosphatase
VSTGHITESEARDHPRRNIITRALGIEPDVRVDWWTLPLIRGDRFVLCSDGLVDEIDDEDITATLIAESDPQSAADRLVQQANDAGGRDNITVIVLDVIDGDDPPDPTQEFDVIPLWADGAADPTPAGTLELDADPTELPPPGSVVPATDASESASHRRTNLARFALGFGVAAAIVVAFVVVSAWARSGYFVAFNDSDQAIIYQGRSGGVLWIDPTAENEVGPSRDELEPDVAAAIDDEPRFDSVDAAAEFIRDGVTTTTTTTSTTTTTTIPPTTTVAPTASSAPSGVTTIAPP